jgi:hypothetical protein
MDDSSYPFKGEVQFDRTLHVFISKFHPEMVLPSTNSAVSGLYKSSIIDTSVQGVLAAANLADMSKERVINGNLNFLGKAQLFGTVLTALVLLPLMLTKGKEFFYGKSSMTVAVAWAAAFLVNCVAVSLPGRFDNSNVSPEGGPWKSLFAPAPWAFAIWGAIYLGEALLSACVLYGNDNPIIRDTLAKAVPWWIAGNLYQSIWCFSFRPKFSNHLWMPAMMLAGGAISMLGAVKTVSVDLVKCLASSGNVKAPFLALFRIPLSLHAGWLCAATLLNLNGWLTYTGAPIPTQISLVFASVYVATILGSVLSSAFKDPFLAFTVAWAVAGLAYQARKMKADIDPVVGPAVIDSIAQTETWLYKLLIAVGLIAPFCEPIF